MTYSRKRKHTIPAPKAHPNIKGRPSIMKNPMYVEWIAIGGSILLAIGLFKILR